MEVALKTEDFDLMEKLLSLEEPTLRQVLEFLGSGEQTRQNGDDCSDALALSVALKNSNSRKN